MRFQIVCTLDHSPGGSDAGAVVYTERNEPISDEKAMEIQQENFPECVLAFEYTDVAEATK